MNAPSSIEKSISKIEMDIDAFYLTECYWEDELFSVKEDKSENYLFALQEVRAAYSDCYVRHNKLVRQLNK